MAIFFNNDNSRICLIRRQQCYELVLKSLKTGVTEQEKAYLKRTPRVISTCIEGFAEKVGEVTVDLTEPATLGNFENFEPYETGQAVCQAGRYSFDCVTIILGGRSASIVVLPATTVGLFQAGLETIMRKQKYKEDLQDKLASVQRVVAEHYGLEVKEVSPEFHLTYINGLGVRIGTGGYRSLFVGPYKKPALIKAGITVQEIADQIGEI